jgi:hypothetical protein
LDACVGKIDLSLPDQNRKGNLPVGEPGFPKVVRSLMLEMERRLQDHFDEETIICPAGIDLNRGKNI